MSGIFRKLLGKSLRVGARFLRLLKVEEGFSDGEGYARQSGNSGFTD